MADTKGLQLVKEASVIYIYTPERSLDHFLRCFSSLIFNRVVIALTSASVRYPCSAAHFS